MKKMSVLLTGAALPLLLGSCARGGKAVTNEADTPPVAVHLHTVALEDVSHPFETGGVVRARNTATLVSRIVAEVREVLVHPGDHVRAGQAVIRLDARDLQAGFARAEAGAAAAEQAVAAARTARAGAEAALSLATATHTRVAELRAKNSATPNELDQVVTGLRAAEAQTQGAEAGIRQAEAGLVAARGALEGARVALSWATITAPFDGIVTEKLVEPGNMASPGVPLMTVEDVRGFRLEVRIDEARVADVDQARPVGITLDSAGVASASQAPTLTGRISEVSRALDPGSHAFLVKVDLPDEARVRSGMFGRARFAGPPHRGVALPASAVLRRGQLTSVFVVDGAHRARMRMVDVSDPVDGRVQVAAGLDAGERVVISPPATLVDGAPVREVRQ